LDKSAIILAGGLSTRFGQDKGLLLLANKPLIKHVMNAIGNLVNEKLVVVSSEAQAANYVKATGLNAKILIDKQKVRCPLVGVLTGFEEAHGEYSILVPCDTPFVSREILSLLLELCPNKTAVIPRWPNGYIEPMQAVYQTKSAAKVTTEALKEGKTNMQCVIDKLHGVRYISTLVLQQLDPELKTFLNVNTALDLKKAEAMLRRNRNRA
jgi:molybdopterin-guanine dinucleotide biosynthesis protein A